ncbi:unnamed protein product, partial [Ectocarpus sp. 13 AM-2016]
PPAFQIQSLRLVRPSFSPADLERRAYKDRVTQPRFHHTTVHTARTTKHEEWTQGYVDQAGPGFSGLSLSLATCGFDHRGRNVSALTPLPPGVRERPGARRYFSQQDFSLRRIS